MRIRVNGGGHVAQIYAIRQAMSKALVAYYQKCKCERLNFFVEEFLKLNNVLHLIFVCSRCR